MELTGLVLLLKARGKETVLIVFVWIMTYFIGAQIQCPKSLLD